MLKDQQQPSATTKLSDSRIDIVSGEVVCTAIRLATKFIETVSDRFDKAKASMADWVEYKSVHVKKARPDQGPSFMKVEFFMCRDSGR